MGKSPPSRRRLLPFRFGTSASRGGGASDDREGDTHELIPVTGADSSSADDSGGGNEEKSQAAPSRKKLRLSCWCFSFPGRLMFLVPLPTPL